MRKLNEECGVVGIFNKDNLDVSKLIYFSLFSLQHRGQESCGIAVNDTIEKDAHMQTISHKDLGLVNEVFNEDILSKMQGIIGVGHVRYSTTGSNLRENVQPLCVKYKKGNLVVAHNGNISNAKQLRHDLEENGVIFQTTSDTEIILCLLARARMNSKSIEEAIEKVMPMLEGAYSLIIMSPQKLIAVRDPFGIRPLCMGKIKNSTIFSSESCALTAVNADYVRDVKPGEIIIVTKDETKSIETHCNKKSALCIFEHLYFARPDSEIDGQSVYESRLEAGKQLSKLYPVDADIVIGVPDSGIIAAVGYSEASGIPYGVGLIKNRYIGRTFIQPCQSMRETSVNIKLSPLKFNVAGKRIVLVDDSIVRGTTIERIIRMLKKAGAKEIHIRIPAPEFLFPCFYGTDVGTKEELISNSYSADALCKKIGADSLGFLPVDNLKTIAKNSNVDFCDACFSGKYPFPIPKSSEKTDFE